jgi:hypothetical protein
MTTTGSQTTQRDPRYAALENMLLDIVGGNREAIDRDRALSAAGDVLTGAAGQQGAALREAAAASGASLSDPSFMAAQRGLESQRQRGGATAARDISMAADEAKLAAQFQAGDMLQRYDPVTQSYQSTKTMPYGYLGTGGTRNGTPYGVGYTSNPMNTRGEDFTFANPQRAALDRIIGDLRSQGYTDEAIRALLERSGRL